MVKGVSRQIVVVRPLDTSLFEKAVFLIRDGALSRQGVTDEDILREADAAAVSCLEPRRRRSGLLPRLFCALGGGAVTALLWLLTELL